MDRDHKKSGGDQDDVKTAEGTEAAKAACAVVASGEQGAAKCEDCN